MYTFTASGHVNIKGEHKTTFEFTRDNDVTPQGDCIIGVNANFDLEKLKQFLTKEEVEITIEIDNVKETLKAKPNPTFCDNHEFVVRITDFISDRTFATRATLSSQKMKRSLMKKLQNPNTTVEVTIS